MDRTWTQLRRRSHVQIADILHVKRCRPCLFFYKCIGCGVLLKPKPVTVPYLLVFRRLVSLVAIEKIKMSHCRAPGDFGTLMAQAHDDTDIERLL